MAALHPEKNRTGHGRGAPVAALWAFAEATVFFIVPDVWLTRMALRDFRRALWACLAATAAALLGGAVMWQWGGVDAAGAERALDRVPAISADMIADVQAQVARDGPASMLRGPLTGVPYKVYAVEAGRAGLGLGEFLAWSVPARLPRFLLLVAVTAGIVALARRVGIGNRAIAVTHLGLWVAFYALYFARMGW